MTKISKENIHEVYPLAKSVYEGSLTKARALLQTRMGKGSAADYIQVYKRMRNGVVYKRTMNPEATEYFLKKILQDNGEAALQVALVAVSGHLDYYRGHTGSEQQKIRDVYKKYIQYASENTEYQSPDELSDGNEYHEGAAKRILVNVYERNAMARQACIAYYGCKCSVCAFDFEKVFGPLGKGYIHVHHLVEISSVGKSYKLDPVKDLRPVCPNCHAMLHRRKNPAYTVDELKNFLT